MIEMGIKVVNKVKSTTLSNLSDMSNMILSNRVVGNSFIGE